MMPVIHVDTCRYTYPSGTSVGPFDLGVHAGELVVLAGATGTGKSTLARVVAGIAQRHGHGRVDGIVRVAGVDPATLRGGERVRTVGFVGQEVDDCVLAGSCAAEVAFARESAGMDAAGVGATLARVGLDGFEGRDPLGLSGGERQRLAIAAALAADPRALVLDEPLSQLDPAGAREMVALLRGIADQGVAVLLVEHRLGLLGGADRVVTLGAPVPAPSQARSTWNGPATLRWSASDAGFAHDGGRGVCSLGLTLHDGERVAVVGGNGAGKSTLLGMIAGRLPTRTGSMRAFGRAIEVPQNADLVLVHATAAQEVAYGAREAARPLDVDAALAAFGLAGLGARAPHALSRGQRLRLAVAATLAADPDVLVLDEPGSGQDVANLHRLFAAIDASARCVVFSSHDPDLVRTWATRVLWIRDGVVVDDAPVARSRWDGFSDISACSRSAGGLRPAVGRDPRLRLALVALLGVAVVLVDSAPALAALGGGVMLAALTHPAVRPWRRALVLGALAVAWSTAVSQALFYTEWPRTPLVALGPVTFWREGALHGLAQSLRFIALSAAGLLLACSTATDRLVAALRVGVPGVRLPFPLVLMVSAMVRFVPLVATEWGQVRRALRARGRAFWRRSPPAWLALEVALLRPVLARSIRRARLLAESLDARGLDPDAPRGVAEPLVWRRPDTAVLLAALSAVGLLVLARGAYLLYTSDLYYRSELRPLYAFVRGWL